MTAHLLFIGGEDHYLRIPFIRAVRDKGFKVSAAANCDPRPFELQDIEYRRFHLKRFVNPGSDWRTLQSLRRLLFDADADIVQSFDTKLGVLVPLAARVNKSVRVIRTINGRGWLYSSNSLGPLALRGLYLPLQRVAAASTSATVFQNQSDHAYFKRRRLLGRGEDIVIPGSGVEIARFRATNAHCASRAPLREELGLGDKEVVITLARVTRQKGIPTLLKAAALVHKIRPSVRFLIVGPRDSEGPFAITDAELSKHADYVIAPGPRADVPALLAMADLFVFPSEYAEGVPRALMEAALCGLPIIATDLPGCREVIRDRWNGYIVGPRRPSDLAETIIKVLQNRDEAALLAARGPDIVRQHFSLDEIVERHCRLYERLLSLGRSVDYATTAAAEIGYS
ncbi:MAG: glycosyltransferase family 4 protein [Pseudomonadota bacterium]